MKDYAFDFSVVSAVYNVENYIREAVESLINQTIGFSRIQVILVDDGSTDGSGAVCDEYREKYPGNVTVLHKENGGVSSARNAGLRIAEGRYLNFMDSDDKFGPDALEKVFRFFQEHEQDTDVAAVPMFFFENASGEHWQNKKFLIDGDVVDLYEQPFLTNLSSSSSFFRTEAAAGIEFNEEQASMEDARFVLEVLFRKMTLGLVKDAVYWYRKRASADSATQTIEGRASWYHGLRQFSAWALETSKKRFGDVPKFVQNEVMYDLQWKLRQEQIPEGILEEQEIREYKDLLWKVVSEIDDDVILAQKDLAPERKYYVLYRKHGKVPEFLLVSEMKTVWERLMIDKEKSSCTLEGYHLFCGPEECEVSPFLLAGRKRIPCELFEREEKNLRILGEPICRAVGFRAVVPLGKGLLYAVPGVTVDGTSVLRKNGRPGEGFPVSFTYRFAYAVLNGWFVCQKDGMLRITPAPCRPVLAIRELQLLREIWKKNYSGGRKAVFGRLAYHLLRPLKRKKLWIISDEKMKAGGKGEELFRCLRKDPPENTIVVFAISKKSSDWARMKKIGPCVSSMSFLHKFLHLLCDENISSQADPETVNPYRGHDGALRDLLTHQRFLLLQ